MGNADRTTGKTNGADIRSLVAANAILDRLLGLPADKIAHTTSGKLQEELKTGLLSRIPNISTELDLQLTELTKLFPNHIGEIRGCGAIRVIQIIDDKTKQPDAKLANKIHLAGANHGIFIRNNESELVIKPPLTITDNELKIGFKNLITAMSTFMQPKVVAKNDAKMLDTQTKSTPSSAHVNLSLLGNNPAESQKKIRVLDGDGNITYSFVPK